jgi:hypothetical protein
MVERLIGSISSSINVHGVVDDISNHYRSIVIDAMRMNQGYICDCLIIDEELNVDVTKFFELLKDFNKPLWDRCINHSKLLVVT